jgi:hypothetical protein
MSAMVRFWRERLMALSRFGIAMAAMIPMIATTISSSMRVKPFCQRISVPPIFFGKMGKSIDFIC